MKKASSQIPAAQLRNLTPLVPKLLHKIRWRGHYATCQQTLELEKPISQIESLLAHQVKDDNAIDSGDDHSIASDASGGNAQTFKRCNRREFDATLHILTQQDVFCVKLQKKGLSLAAADDLLEKAADKLEKIKDGAAKPRESYHCAYITVLTCGRRSL